MLIPNKAAVIHIFFTDMWNYTYQSVIESNPPMEAVKLKKESF